MPKAQAVQINWQFTGSAGIMQVEHTADCFGGAWFKSPLSTEVWHPRHIWRETAFQFAEVLALNGETYVVRVNEFSAMCNWQVVGVQVGVQILIGTNTRPTQHCHFEWPWVSLSDLAKYSVTRSVAHWPSRAIHKCRPATHQRMSFITVAAAKILKNATQFLLIMDSPGGGGCWYRHPKRRSSVRMRIFTPISATSNEISVHKRKQTQNYGRCTLYPTKRILALRLLYNN